VVLKIGSLEEGPDSLDHEATWLLGHTAQVTFGELRIKGVDLLVPAVLHVTCRYLKEGMTGEARCQVHGFEGPTPAVTAGADQPRQLGANRFQLIQDHKTVRKLLTLPRRTLPVIQGDNPCATAPCRTADNRIGAACCRDLQVEIMCERENMELEALVRSRRSPYLCKVTREGDHSLDAEIISACGYLEAGTRNCSLHGRTRQDGRPAKPDLCSDWPPKGKGLHPGCVFGPSSGRKRKKKL
jgi:hypothetical protein